MSEKWDGGYYAIIPADVRYDPDLRPNAKLLYGELTSLCNQKGYCWATNDHFSELYGLSVGTISRLISQLESKGYIRCEMVATDKGSERRIYAGVFLVQQGGVDEKRKTPLDENDKGGLDEIVKQNNKINNTKEPPKAPQGAASEKKEKRQRRQKSVPSWRPEKFEGFWNAYPRDEARIKAVEQWDRLSQDKELMDRYGGDEEALLLEIARGLKRHLESREWQENVGIPYAFRWLRDRRWTEKTKRPAASETMDALIQTAPRACHTELINGEEVVIYDEST